MSVTVKYYPERENRRANRGFILTNPAVYQKKNPETGRIERQFVNYVEFQPGENILDDEVYQVVSGLDTFKELAKIDAFIVNKALEVSGTEDDPEDEE